MEYKKKSLFGLIAWGISVAIVCLLFFIILNDYTAIRVASLVFTLLALTVGLVVFLTTDKMGKLTDRLMLVAGLYVISFLYIIAAGVNSLFFIVVNSGMKWLMLFQFLTILIYALIFVAIFFASNYIGTVNAKTLKAVHTVKGYESRIFEIANNPKYSQYSERLNKLYEVAKYTDCSTQTQVDDSIEAKLSVVDDVLLGSPERANEFLDELILLYKMRGEEARIEKRGGF